MATAKAAADFAPTSTVAGNRTTDYGSPKDTQSDAGAHAAVSPAAATAAARAVTTDNPAVPTMHLNDITV